MTDGKCVCTGCNWRGLNSELLSAPNPFIEGETLYACPGCRDNESHRAACATENCWKEASCGGPSKDGVYRHTCYKHADWIHAGTKIAEAAPESANNAAIVPTDSAQTRANAGE